MLEVYDLSGMPADIDFVNYSNEDIGFTLSLTAGTNDVFAFALPYPATLNLFDQTIVVWALEFIFHVPHNLFNSTTLTAMTVHLAMLDREFGVSWFGDLVDAEDEAWKAQFAGPMYVGRNKFNVTATAAAEGSERSGDGVQDVLYIPPIPLDLITPLFIQLTNASKSVTLATNVVAEANMTQTEQFTIRVWFTKRNLTTAEQATRNMAIRFQRLDS